MRSARLFVQWLNCYSGNSIGAVPILSTVVMIEHIKLNTLLYADDIILLSNSEQGLQRSLNVLNEFSNDWKSEVKYEKSKVIVFNSNGKLLINKFKFQDKF